MSERLEQALLAWYAAHADSPGVAAQCAAAWVHHRQWTEAGLFVYLDLPPDAERCNDGRVTPAPELIRGPQLQHGASVDLWVENGRLQFMEIVPFGEPLPLDLFPFEIV